MVNDGYSGPTVKGKALSIHGVAVSFMFGIIRRLPPFVDTSPYCYHWEKNASFVCVRIEDELNKTNTDH